MVDLVFVDGYVFDGDEPLTGDRAASYLQGAVLLQTMSTVNGSFAAAWTEGAKTTIVTDRVGTRPVYYTRVGASARVSQDAWGLAPTGLERPFELDAALELLTFGYVLSNRTLIKDVFEADPGSVTVLDGKQISSVRYWRYGVGNATPSPESISGSNGQRLDELVGEIGERCSSLAGHLGMHRVGLNLTGGRDSRLIGSMMTRAHLPLAAFTMRAAEREDRYAADVAHALGIPHTGLPMWDRNPFGPPASVLDALTPTTNFSVAGQPMSLMLTGPWPVDGYVSGHLGDTLTGSAMTEAAFAQELRGPQALALWWANKQVRVRASTLRGILRESSIDVDEPVRRLTALALESTDLGLSTAVTRVNLEQRQRRYILRDFLALRQLGPSFLPLGDALWLDFWTSVPSQGLRSTRLMQEAMRTHLFTERPLGLANIPFAPKPGSRPTTRTHRAAIAGRRRLAAGRARLQGTRSATVHRVRHDREWTSALGERLDWLLDRDALNSLEPTPFLLNGLRSLAYVATRAST